MIFSKDGNVTIITQEKGTIVDFVKKLDDQYNKIKNDNVVINLTALTKVTLQEIIEFLDLSNRHRAKKLSFVIVTENADFSTMPDELIVVPTLHEANDVIEMEEIERDLGF